MTHDHTDVIRLRQHEAGETIARRRGALVSSFPAIVGRVFANPRVPTGTGAFVSLHPVDVAGNEAESAPGVLFEESSRTFFAYVVGSKPPVAGDYLVCRFVGDRWVAERMSGAPSGVSIPGCPCASSPPVLQMTSSKPESNFHIFQSAVLAYGPTPPALLPLGIGQNSYLSTTSFTDITTGDQFRYHFSCYFGYYFIIRVYETSIYGSPFRDLTRYRWPIGLSGNTCTPFLLVHGQVFSGGDPSCIVTVSE